MHAHSTDAAIQSTYRDGPPVLIAGDSDAALARAVRTVEAAGVRVADRVRLAEAPARVERQAASSALWVELGHTASDEMDKLLDRINVERRFPAIIAAPSALLDPIIARLNDDAAELVIDGDEVERTAALAVALAGAHHPDRIADVAADRSAARLRQLSEEVGRIASTLARLSAGPAAIARPVELEPTAGEVPPVTAEAVRAVICARRLRARYFPEDLFADPAWDMLLDLLQAEIAVFVRRADPHDGRRVFVELAPQASNALRRYFAEVGQPAIV